MYLGGISTSLHFYYNKKAFISFTDLLSIYTNSNTSPDRIEADAHLPLKCSLLPSWTLSSSTYQSTSILPALKRDELFVIILDHSQGFHTLFHLFEQR